MVFKWLQEAYRKITNRDNISEMQKRNVLIEIAEELEDEELKNTFVDKSKQLYFREIAHHPKVDEVLTRFFEKLKFPNRKRIVESLLNYKGSEEFEEVLNNAEIIIQSTRSKKIMNWVAEILDTYREIDRKLELGTIATGHLSISAYAERNYNYVEGMAQLLLNKKLVEVLKGYENKEEVKDVGSSIFMLINYLENNILSSVRNENYAMKTKKYKIELKKVNEAVNLIAEVLDTSRKLGVGKEAISLLSERERREGNYKRVADSAKLMLRMLDEKLVEELLEYKKGEDLKRAGYSLLGVVAYGLQMVAEESENYNRKIKEAYKLIEGISKLLITYITEGNKEGEERILREGEEIYNSIYKGDKEGVYTRFSL